MPRSLIMPQLSDTCHALDFLAPWCRMHPGSCEMLGAFQDDFVEDYLCRTTSTRLCK